MRNFVKFSMLALVAIATTASAAELEFHGYTRTGLGFNTQGGGQVMIGLAGADTKFRLGNEADVVIEPGFEYKFAVLEDKSAWGVNVMPAFYRGYGNITGIADGDLPVSFKQIYFFGNNVPQLLNGKIWAGRRYQDRLQTGINDQFLENGDGEGAGIEDMDLGFAKWTVDIQMNPYDHSAVATDVGGTSNKLFKVATRFTGIQTFSKDAALQLWFNIGNIQSKASGVAKVDPSYHAAVYHTWNLGDLGSNLAGFAIDTSKNAGVTETKWRAVIQHGIVFASARTGLDVIAEYRSDKVKGAKANNWFMVGARTDTQLSGPFRLLLEAGYDNQKAGSAKATNLFKGTGAFAVSGGNDPWSRPTFRLFYTYASWSDVGALADGRANVVFAGKKSGGQYGIQAEGWW